jgi:hypothetical protein
MPKESDAVAYESSNYESAKRLEMTQHVPASVSLWSINGSPWFGERLMRCPDGFWTQRRVALVSSRIGRSLDLRSDWLQAFRSAVLRSAAAGQLVLTSRGTTCDRLLISVGRVLQIPLAYVEGPGAARDVALWLTHSSLHRYSRPPPGIASVSISPSLGPIERAESPADTLPMGDRLLAMLADDLYVLYVRRQGTLARLLDLGFQSGAFQGRRVLVAVGSDRVPRALAERWLNGGALAWSIEPTVAWQPPSRDRAATNSQPAFISRSDGWPNFAPNRYLFHWTRRQVGAWPDQTELDYAREILSGCFGSRSAAATLRRIVAMRRLIATSRLTRGPVNVVSFTARPLQEFASRRQFRSHQMRWDFEPYGVAIARQWLEQRGARPVIYGDEATWRDLSPALQPYFQLSHTRGRGRAAMDWTSEAEWRHIGDVDLSDLPTADGFVFVPDGEEAEQIATVSRWPVVVVVKSD